MSSEEWKKIELDEVCQIICGATPSTNVPDYWSNEIKWATAKDISESTGYKIYDTERKISELGFKHCSTKMIPSESTVLIARGATMGKSCMLGTSMAINQTCYALIPNKSKINPHFLFYSVKHLDKYFQQIAHGAIFNTVIGSGLRETEIFCPSLITQNRIADILSGLDDKIELNRQTNATLEAIAQAIFKEWFVDFNFPGATGEMVESELGMIPKKWKAGTLADIIILTNETMSPGVNPDKLFNHYSIPAFDSGRVPLQEYGSTILSNKYKVKNNSILVSKLNPRIPRIWPLNEVNQENSICSTEFQVFLPKKAHYYSYAANLFYQPSVMDTMTSRASGTSGSHQRINPQDILDINIVVPPNEVFILYDTVVGNYIKCAKNGLEESISLVKIRDSILPKLMNGDMRIEG